MGLADGETIRRNVYCRRFDTIQECNGPTDGRMEMSYEQVNITCCAEWMRKQQMAWNVRL